MKKNKTKYWGELVEVWREYKTAYDDHCLSMAVVDPLSVRSIPAMSFVDFMNFLEREYGE